jgi:hypothetical protein
VCNGEAVAYAQVVESHPDFEYVGLNVADTPQQARAFLRKYGWTWPQIEDPGRVLEGELGGLYQPVVIVLEEEGRVAARHIGAGDEATWEALARNLS